MVLALSRRLAGPAATVGFLVMLATPGGVREHSWLAPVEGTFPAAGPRHNAGEGGYGISPNDVADRPGDDRLRPRATTPEAAIRC